MNEQERYENVCAPWMKEHGEMIRTIHSTIVGNGKVGLRTSVSINQMAIKGLYVLNVLILGSLIAIWLGG